MTHPFRLILLLFFSSCMIAKEPTVLILERDESVAHLTARGDTLAIAVAYRATWDPSKGPALPTEQSAVVLLREGAPLVRTPQQSGFMRSIVATPSGFVAARVTYDQNANSTVYFFEVDPEGRVTEMPWLEIDLVGIWVGNNGEIFAYSSRAVFCWTSVNPAWVKLPLDPAANADAIRKIVTLADGSLLVVTDRLLKGFKSLGDSPVFVKDLATYPKPINAFGDDRWWIVTTDGSSQKIGIVSASGKVREIASLDVVNPHDLLFSGDKTIVVCAREGGNIHKYSYYALNRDGSGSLRGPYMLPDDTISTCIWRDSVVSGGASNRVFMTAIER